MLLAGSGCQQEEGRPGPRAGLVAVRKVGEGGYGAGRSLAVARTPAFSGCGAAVGCPRTEAPGPAASVLKKDDLQKEGAGGG